MLSVEVMMNPDKYGYEACDDCNGYGSSLKEDSDKCTSCGGSGLVKKSKEEIDGEFILDEYKKAEATRRVNKAMEDIHSVIVLLGLENAENDLFYGLAGACIDLDQIVIPQLKNGVTKGVWC